VFIFVLIVVMKLYHVNKQQQFFNFLFCLWVQMFQKIVSCKTASDKDNRWEFEEYLHNIYKILNRLSDTCWWYKCSFDSKHRM
jgi:hypothetical protein